LKEGLTLRLVSPAELSLLETHLSGLIDRTLGGHDLGELTDALRAYVLSGGKRIRPQLCLWTYQHCGGTESSNTSHSVLDLACAWELFHAFLLAHDDIIDNGDYRRAQPSLHRRLAALDSGSPIFGINMAIVGGDLLFTAALSLLHNLELPGDRYRDVLKLFSRVASTTGFGQAIDIVQAHVPLDAVREEELLREYHWKTAAYTFEGPMMSGALAAGASVPAQQAISRFSLALGQAYQLQNDLVDLAAPAHEGCDLVQGKRTITLIRARAAMSPPDRAALDYALASATLGGTDGVAIAERLRQDLLDRGAVARTADVVTTLLVDSETAASDSALPPTLRTGLHQLLQSLRAAYFR